MAYSQQVVFSVGNGEFAIDISRVSAIETLSNVVTIPNSLDYILGIMNLRGEVLPVYSLRKKFGLEEVPETSETKIIVTKSNGLAIAFKVDSVKEILDCRDDMVTTFPPIARNVKCDFVKKVASINGRLILLMDENLLVTADDSEVIKQLVNNV